MKAPKQLRPPSNWKDFEVLCCRLWEEIWKDPEITMHGREGQAQKGVDIYSLNRDTASYFGIQCKGKDNYTDKNLTEQEIKTEIQKAKLFTPPLSKLYFATTGVRDAKLQEVERTLNLQHIAQGLFTIKLFFWEDIVELIDQHRRTYNWYVNGQEYIADYDVKILFYNYEKELIINPRFEETLHVYVKNIEEYSFLKDNNDNVYPRSDDYLNARLTVHNQNGNIFPKKNYGQATISLVIANVGNLPIEEFKLNVQFQNVSSIAEVSSYLSDKEKKKQTTFIYDKDSFVQVIGGKNIVVGGDFFKTDEIKIYPYTSCEIIQINWRLVSKFYQTKGELFIRSLPQICVLQSISEIEEGDEEKIESLGIYNYFY